MKIAMKIHLARATARVLTNTVGEVNRVAVRLVVISLLFAIATGFAQDEPKLTVDVVDFQKLLPILPEAPSGWSAEKPEGSTTDAGGAKITNVHRDYKKGDADNA